MNLVWFRNDLRVRDNPALFAACQQNAPVVALAAITPRQWDLQDESRSRTEFWLACLRDLQSELQQLNIPLKLIQAEDNSELPAQIQALAKSLGCTGLYFNHELPEFEQGRDRTVVKALKAAGIDCYPQGFDMVLPPGQLLTKQETPFKVFTPFARSWRSLFMQQMPAPLPAPDARVSNKQLSDVVPDLSEELPQTGAGWRSDLWPAGAESAHQRLVSFCNEKLLEYPERRDFPGMPATSTLSPYLSVGVLSARQCLQAVQLALSYDEWVGHSWVNELIWREFYRYLLYHYPELSRWKPFKPDVEERIQWQSSPQAFQAWCRGETGFPLVDAGMRQLHETGWMHNRVRMVTASFLTKLLRVDWREGARFFMQHLIDGDFASNMGGWQWSASVGADAAPYFRIFNPTAQAKKFDSSAVYTDRWLSKEFTLGGLAPPIIDYPEARKASLLSYQEMGEHS